MAALLRRWTTLAGVVCLLGSGASAAEYASLDDIRFWTAGDVCRIAIQTDGEVHYDYDRLAGPDRVYVDLIDTRPSQGRKFYTIPVTEGPVKQIRVALKTPTITRVVLDLEEGAATEYSVSQLAVPDRIVVELKTKFAPGKPSPAGAAPPAVETSAMAKPAPPPARAFQAPEPRPVPVPKSKGEIFRNQDVPKVGTRQAPASTPSVLMAGVDIKPSRGRRLPPAEPKPAAEPPVKEEPAAPPAPTEVPPADDAALKSLTRILGLKLNRVVLDPGHGGNDHGTTGPNGVVEKELVLDVTMRLGKMLESTGTQVIYTRKEDRFVSLDARTEMANQQRADLFLSIHANSSPYRNVLGTETYYLNLTTVRADLDVAARENASSQKAVHELSDLLSKIARNEKVIESRDFALRIQGATHELVTKTHGRTYNRGVKKAPFVVLIGAKMPAVLVEIGFVTNPKEEAMMKKGDYRQRLAEALFKGVAQYAESLNRVRLARNAE